MWAVYFTYEAPKIWGKVRAYKMVGALIPADRMVFGVITCHGYLKNIFKICVYPRKSAFYATKNLAIFADFCWNLRFWPNSTSDYTIFRALRDLIFYQHTPTYTLSKMGEKEQTKIFIWPLRGASKVPQDIGIQPAIFLSPGFRKNELLAKFSIRLHNIQGSERPDFLSTHTYIHPK